MVTRFGRRSSPWRAGPAIPRRSRTGTANRYRLYKQTELEKILDKLEQSVSTRAKADGKRRAK